MWPDGVGPLDLPSRLDRVETGPRARSLNVFDRSGSDWAMMLLAAINPFGISPMTLLLREVCRLAQMSFNSERVMTQIKPSLVGH